MSRRILLTGHDGYIGSVLAPRLIEHGYEVVGLDCGYFEECAFVPVTCRLPHVRKDLRDVKARDLEGFDAVVHLAALSNDAVGDLNRLWTNEINFTASVRLAELAKAAGVRRFLFSSSCIMYGQSEAVVVDEASTVDPKTEYARSKVDAERAISGLAHASFSPTFLRNGTVYGVSPRMRFDTVLNNLTAQAVATGKVVLHGDGRPWRPVVHVEDLARSFIHVLGAPVDVVHDQAFNNGHDSMNRQVIDLGNVVADVVSGCRVECQSRPDADQRTYKVDFGKFAKAFPGFRFHRTVEDGTLELYEVFRRVGLSEDVLQDRRFTRLKWLRHMISSGRLDATLRWTATARSSDD